ncbi:hypothetical protein C8R45DRAFT_1209413 [Mycena sanguinolenta]|nr:hypothetical protein C8R45DRAFT_1209413 [Mycena sanguinolenta]
MPAPDLRAHRSPAVPPYLMAHSKRVELFTLVTITSSSITLPSSSSSPAPYCSSPSPRSILLLQILKSITGLAIAFTVPVPLSAFFGGPGSPLPLALHQTYALPQYVCLSPFRPCASRHSRCFAHPPSRSGHCLALGFAALAPACKVCIALASASLRSIRCSVPFRRLLAPFRRRILAPIRPAPTLATGGCPTLRMLRHPHALACSRFAALTLLPPGLLTPGMRPTETYKGPSCAAPTPIPPGISPRGPQSSFSARIFDAHFPSALPISTRHPPIFSARRRISRPLRSLPAPVIVACSRLATIIFVPAPIAWYLHLLHSLHSSGSRAI